LAAGLLLVAGGTVWFLTGTLTRGGLPRGPQETTVADNRSEADAAPAVPAGTPKTEETISLAQGPATMPNPADEIDMLEYGPPAPAVTLAAAPPAMAVSRAVELARENRLVIRVAARTLEESAARIEALAERVRPESAWRINTFPSPAVVATLTRRQEPLMTPGRPDAHEMAAARSSLDGVSPQPALPAAAAAPQPGRRVFSVESRLDESALEALLATLSESGQAAEFVEAAEPLPPEAPAMTPTSLLWWTQPPACWAPWGSVPVVVEQKN
jgi:hypothetical protein